MKNFFVWGLVLIVALILQSTIFAMLNYKGTHADILLLVTASAALLNGRDKGAAVGFCAGVLQDLASGTFFGINILPKMLIGYILGSIEKKVFKDSGVLPILASLFVTAASSVLTGVLIFMLGYRVDILIYWLNVMLPLLVFHVVLAYPVHIIIYKISALLKE